MIKYHDQDNIKNIEFIELMVLEGEEPITAEEVCQENRWSRKFSIHNFKQGQELRERETDKEWRGGKGSRREGSEKAQVGQEQKLSKLAPSDVLPRARPHFLKIP